MMRPGDQPSLALAFRGLIASLPETSASHCSGFVAGTPVVVGTLHNMMKLLAAGGHQLLSLGLWGEGSPGSHHASTLFLIMRCSGSCSLPSE